MNTNATLLLDAMRAAGNREFRPHELLKLARTTLRDDGRVAAEVLDCLRQLEEDEQINRLPSRARGAAGWDRSVSPALPSIVRIRTMRKEARLRATTSWAEEFSVAASIPASPRRDAMAALNDWFIENRDRPMPPVPFRVRSAGILGDEKAMDPLVKGATLLGTIPLALLHSYNPDFPLVHENAASTRPVGLIVENSHSYDLVSSINRTTGSYRTVVWGGGRKVAKNTLTFLALRRIMDTAGVSSFEYAGDVDPEGIRIAHALSLVLGRSGISVVPASGFYEAMLESRPFACRTDQAEAGEALDWLPSTLSERCRSLFLRRERIAQEILDHHAVADILEAAAPTATVVGP